MRVLNGLVLMAAGAVWMASGSEHEHAVLSPLGGAADPVAIESLESQVAASPNDDAKLRTLAQAYMDARAPGLALAIIQRAPAPLQGNAKVEHLYARALIDEGRAQDALTVERDRTLVERIAGEAEAEPDRPRDRRECEDGSRAADDGDAG